MREWRDGDVVRWSWKDVFRPETDPYWCKSRIGVYDEAKGGLVDTFWSHSTDGSLDEDKIEVKYLGNLGDYKEIGLKGELQFYEPEDTMDLSHSNNRGKYYIKKDAKRSKKAVEEVIKRKIEEIEIDIQRMEWDLQQEKKYLANIDEKYESYY